MLLIDEDCIYMRDAFYKYLSAESLKKTLSSTTHKYSSPSEFNDPFDNYVDIHWIENPRELESKIRSVILDLTEDKDLVLDSLFPIMPLLVSIFRNIQPKNRTILLEKLTDIYTQEQLDSIYLDLNKRAKEALSDMSIFCVAEEYNNLLMWAHYAENHRGGVIKLLPIKEVDSPLLSAKKVNYSLAVPVFEIIDLIKDEREIRHRIIDAITLTKSRDWEYEKEWRVVSVSRNPSKKYELLPFAKEEVGALYLGCRITETDKNEIIDIMKRKYPWASIYQAKPKRNEFSLCFTELE